MSDDNNSHEARFTDFKNTIANCTSKITKFFLYHFGNGTIPDGYWTGDEYGPKYKRDDFVELFPIFHILLFMTALWLLAIVFLILFLVWLHKSRHMERKKCDCRNKLAIFILLILLLLLIFMTFPLYMTLKSGLDVKGRNSSDNSNKRSPSELDRQIKHISQQINTILITDFSDMKEKALGKFNKSDPKQYKLPNTIKARKEAQEQVKNFDDFIVKYIESDFERVLFFDDAYRMFSRNISAYLAAAHKGRSYIEKDEPHKYLDHFPYNLNQWGINWYSSQAISKLMHHYQNVKVDSVSAEKYKMEMHESLDNLLNEKGREAITLNKEIKNVLKIEKIEKNSESDKSVKIANFTVIMCYIAIVVLIVYVIILMCALCKKHNRNKAMVKPLTCIYVILVLLFEVMAIAFFFPFFYGVIDYNKVCNDTTNVSTRKSFQNLMITDCTEQKTIYTIMANNKLVDHSINQWKPIKTSNLKKKCKDDCTPLDMKFIKDTQIIANDFPPASYCYISRVDPSKDAKSWKLFIDADISRYKYEGMTDKSPSETYYWARKNMTGCILNFADKIEVITNDPYYKVFVPQYTQKQKDSCQLEYNVARSYRKLTNSSIDEINDACQKVYKDCLEYVNKASEVNKRLDNYKTNALTRLRTEVGPCKSIKKLLQERRSEYCKCDLYVLNGIWVGCLLFLLALFMSLMLLPYVICIFKTCDNYGHPTRRLRRGQQGSQRQSAQPESIVLPPVALPRAAIRMIQANPSNAEVHYMLKKKAK